VTGDDGQDPRFLRSRDAILAAALLLLQEHGPAAVTHQRVAQRAGVGRATVYRHWPRADQMLFDAMAGADLPFFLNPTSPIRGWLLREAKALTRQLRMPTIAAVTLTLMHSGHWNPEVARRRDAALAAINARITAGIDIAVASGELTQRVQEADVSAVILGPIVYRAVMEEKSVSKKLLETLINTLGEWTDTSTE
jgi:AcrR family transcriptional regulator